MPPTEPEPDGPGVCAWLWLLYGLVLTMVMLGGITRLTGSGLSMVEWRPLMGGLPPLTQAEWDRVFALYQASPQYAQVNHWMTLADFRAIFFWEYLHRLVGRSLGVVALGPWVYFAARGKMSPGTRRWTLAAAVFGGLQGTLGWIMVRSGLVDMPAVSHFRLAAHLLLAFLVAQWILWRILDLRAPKPGGTKPPPPGLRRATGAFLAGLLLQVVYGAFMAGTRAGWLFSSFPDMNGAFLPGPFLTDASLVHDLLSNPSVIHWLHRTLAYGLAVAALALVRAVFRSGPVPTGVRRAASVLAIGVGIQVGLGVLTVVWHVPTSLAVAHQATAFGLVSVTVWLLHQLRPSAP